MKKKSKIVKKITNLTLGHVVNLKNNTDVIPGYSAKVFD